MSFGLALLINIVLIVVVAGWLRRVVIRHVEPRHIVDRVSQEVQSVIAELNQAADNSVTLLEDRVRMLNQRLRVADQRIEELEELLAERRELRHPKRENEAASQPTPETPETVRFRRVDPSVANVQLVEETVHGSSETPANEDLEQSGSDDSKEDNQELPDVSTDQTARVLALHESGLSSDVIAARTGVAIGEVELIISLRQRRNGR